jgi:2-keto-4-pentenoate hydratase/2-oxohepta-3-ene-1,7-dioic acid hydratase in catechol pathway
MAAPTHTPGRRPAIAPLASAAALAFVSCSTPLAKPEALDPDVLARVRSVQGLLESAVAGDEYVVTPSPEWMRLRPGDDLTFVGIRRDGVLQFCVALECAPARDELVVLPLATDETPLTVLANATRKAELTDALRRYRSEPAAVSAAVVVPLREAMANNRIGPPIPDPKRVIAVAANYPSHLQYDLETEPEQIEKIATTPPRLFLKHPPQAVPGTTMPSDLPFRGVIGPFDDVVYPELTWLPKDEGGTSNAVPTALDYEVELGIVIGRTLTWAEVQQMDDAAIYGAIVGYLLVSDVKARNPQVYERALTRHQAPQSWAGPYLTGDSDVDLVIGKWDAASVAWWSYAASLGDFTSVGPYFVASDGRSGLPDCDLIGARTYGWIEGPERGFAIPEGREAGRYYLRQAARPTETAGHRDSLLWRVPQIVRAALDPEQALASTPDATILNAGDVIALGTPGGVTLTVRGRSFYRILGMLMFWWNARDWHDAFFANIADYLHAGDRLFQWGEGLGCQSMAIRRVAWPPPPSVVPANDKAP